MRISDWSSYVCSSDLELPSDRARWPEVPRDSTGRRNAGAGVGLRAAELPPIPKASGFGTAGEVPAERRQARAQDRNGAAGGQNGRWAGRERGGQYVTVQVGDGQIEKKIEELRQ